MKTQETVIKQGCSATTWPAVMPNLPVPRWKTMCNSAHLELRGTFQGI